MYENEPEVKKSSTGYEISAYIFSNFVQRVSFPLKYRSINGIDVILVWKDRGNPHVVRYRG